jgi:hypothetical protein
MADRLVDDLPPFHPDRQETSLDPLTCEIPDEELDKPEDSLIIAVSGEERVYELCTKASVIWNYRVTTAHYLRLRDIWLWNLPRSFRDPRYHARTSRPTGPKSGYQGI